MQNRSRCGFVVAISRRHGIICPLSECEPQAKQKQGGIETWYLCRQAHASPAARIHQPDILYHDAVKRLQQNRTCCGFTWFNAPKALCASTGACAVHMRSRVNGSFGGYYTIKIRVCTGGNMQCPPPWRSVRGASGQDGKKEKICVKYYQLYRKMAV